MTTEFDMKKFEVAVSWIELSLDAEKKFLNLGVEGKQSLFP